MANGSNCTINSDLDICAGDPFEEIEDYKTTEEVQTVNDFMQLQNRWLDIKNHQ